MKKMKRKIKGLEESFHGIQLSQKAVESFKETDQKEIWAEMQAVQASNNYVVNKFDELSQDFNTVMNGYSKLGLQVEELDKNVNKKITMEDDVEKLKEQLDRLEAYIYSGKRSQEEEKERLQETVSLTEDSPHFVQGEVEQIKADKKTHFARMVKNWMTLPDEERAEVVKRRTQPEVKKVKPTTMKKAYERFIKATHEKRRREEDGEEAEKVDVQQDQEESAILEEEMDLPVRGTVQKFHRTAQAITLLQDMQKTQQEGRLVRAREMEAFRTSRDEEEQQLSVESLDAEEPPTQQLSVESTKSTPQKATLLFGDDKASQQLKERIVIYIKNRLEEMETRFFDKMHTVETSAVEVQMENEVLQEEIHVLKSRLAVMETNQYKLEERLTAVEEKAHLNDLHIEEIMIALDKKADRSDTVQGMTKKDMSVLEDRMLRINERTLSDIEELRSFLKEYFAKMRDELKEKVSGFDMDCRLEPLAGRLKRLEKMLKDVALKARVLECQTIGPVEVKRYLHCEDGKRIKPLRKPTSHWTSATQSEKSIYDPKLPDEPNAEDIEAEVQKRLEDAIFRDSKHLIGGGHTKIKVART